LLAIIPADKINFKALSEMKYLLLASSALLLCAAPAMAQEQLAQEEVIVADNVIYVFGHGLPSTPATPAYSVVEISRDQLTAAASGRLEDALANVAGFQQFRRSDSRSANPSAQGATLRGLGGNASSRALVLLDGVPIGDPFFGHIPFGALAPERLDSIRVTRGGGSGPFGAGALAGTIELESAGPGASLFDASALVSDRSDSELSASIAPEFGDGFAVVSGRWERGDGFYTTPAAQRVSASVPASYDAWSASARVVQRVAGLEVQARALLFDDQRTLRFAGADNSSEGQDFSLRVVSRGPWQVDALAYAQWRNFTNSVISSTTFIRTLDQKDTPSEGQGGKIEIRPPLGRDNVLRLGADFRRAAGDLREDAFNGGTGALTQNRFAGGENDQYGVFLEDDWNFGALTLTGGVRADHYTIKDGYYRSNNAAGAVVRNDSFASRSDDEISWRGGVLLRAGEMATLRAAAYSGFRLPTLNELYRPFVVFPVTTNANAGLLPERLEGWEAGIDLAPAPGFTLQVTWFDNTVKDAIANVTTGVNIRTRQNLAAIEARGLEIAAHLVRGDFGFDGSVALTDAEVRGDGAAAVLDGKRPAQVPEFASSATLSWRPQSGAVLAATLRHVGAQFEDDLETDVLPAATTVDLFGQVPLVSRLSGVVRVENLFDTEIVTRNQGGSIDLGVPLTLWVGLRWGF